MGGDGDRKRSLRIGLVSPESPGHLNAISSLGIELTARGHTAVLIAGREVRRYAERRGLGFEPVGVADGRDREIVEGFAQGLAADGLRALPAVLRTSRLQTDVLLDELPDVVERSGIDGLVVDTLVPGAAAAADTAGWPYVVAHAAYVTSVFPVAEEIDGQNPVVRSVSRVLARTASAMVPPVQRMIHRVDPKGPGRLLVDWDVGLARVSQQPEWFATRHRELPAHFHYTGPWTRPTPGGRADEFDWTALDDRPLVYVSMGTVFNDRQEVFEAVLAALGDLPVQAVVTRGGGDLDFGSDVPGNVMIEDFVPQLEILDRSAVCINHAGLSTVFECLERDVPMLCLPSSRESRWIASRVDELGLAKVLAPGVTAREIRGHLAWLLEDAAPRRVAAEFGERLRAVDGVAKAVDVVEQAIGTGEPVLR